MGFLWSCSALMLLPPLLLWLEGSSLVLGYDVRERDALCDADGCFVVYFERKIFLDSWRTCKDKGGDLATIKRREDANAIATFFSTLDLRQSRTTVQVWIGLQRQPRQCSTTHPLRGFSWTTGDQDTEYTNWDRVDSAGMCLVPRCVVMSYSTQERSDNFKWLDGPCSVPVDGYICRYSYKGMCGALWSEGAGNALYTTPFNLVSSLLTHVPFGSVANMPCPAGSTEDQSQVLCMQMEDGSVGWSREPPLCSGSSVSHRLCVQDNGGCEHFCRTAGGLFCECADGYSLRADGRTCELTDACQGYPCEFECLPLPDGYRCACPDGYMLAPDEHACLDVNECLQNPCEQVCKNAPGTFECQCWDGYLPDDRGGCEDIDECKHSPCEQSCENTLGSYVCHCHLGFSFDPEDHGHCQDVDECQIVGICEQMCANYEGGFECYCEEGYKLMSDHYTCQKVAVTQSFPWATHQPGPDWDAVEYAWNPEPSNTGWSTEEDQPLDWLTETPSFQDSDVIWVTSAPQDDRPLLDVALTLLTRETKRAEDDSSEWDLRSQTDAVSTTSHDTTLPSAGSRTTSDWNKEEEEVSTAIPLLSISTVSEGAWNWGSGLVTSPQNPETSGVTHNVSTDSDLQRQAEGKHSQKDSSQGRSDRKKSYVDVSPNSDVPIQLTTSQPPRGGNVGPGQNLDSVQTDREQKQSSTLLLVGLLVPICIFLVVMVALGIIYCTRCAVQPRNKTITDCYHWISGAHDKQGPPDPTAGAKTSV